MLIDEREWPESAVQSVWASLVADSKVGTLKAGPFVAWFRSADQAQERLTIVERRRLMGVRARRMLDASTAVLAQAGRADAKDTMRSFVKQSASLEPQISGIVAQIAELRGEPERPSSACGALHSNSEILMTPMARPQSARSAPTHSAAPNATPSKVYRTADGDVLRRDGRPSRDIDRPKIMSDRELRELRVLFGKFDVDGTRHESLERTTCYAIHASRPPPLRRLSLSQRKRAVRCFGDNGFAHGPRQASCYVPSRGRRWLWEHRL